MLYSKDCLSNMKKYIIFGICLLLVMITLVIANTIHKNRTIEDVTYFYFSVSGGMDPDSNIDYKLSNDTIIYKKGYYANEKRVPVTKEFKEELLKIINEEKIAGWDGFNKVDKYVLDGSGFSLEIKYSDKDYIRANGYVNYPDNYRSFSNRIYKLFEQYTK